MELRAKVDEMMEVQTQAALSNTNVVTAMGCHCNLIAQPGPLATKL